MAKAKLSAAPVATRPRICFERIIPDELDPERALRRGIREDLAAKKKARSGKPVKEGEKRHLARMAVAHTKRWPLGSTVSCRFLDGSPKMKRNVQAVAHEWEKHANLRFKFIRTGAAEIRISFYADDGSWSAVGRDALNHSYFPLHQPTMNYGWFRDDTDDAEYRRVTLHEFGHAIGCVHEHESPRFPRKWNRDAVMEYFQGSPNFWSPDDIRENVLHKYSARGITATVYDPRSIMLYDFAAELFTDGDGPTNVNTKLSVKDVAMIKRMYPK